MWLSVLIVTYSLTALGQAALSTPDSPSTFRSDVSLVPVHVVVRDHQGHPIGNLSKDDFQVFDQDKLQVIQQFSAERTGGPASNLAGTAGSTASPEDRFTVYLFDDLHLQHEDLVRAREAADRQIAHLSSFPWERAALYTTSGQNRVDFGADPAKLRAALAHLETKGRPSASDCPTMTYYMADLIEETGDREALNVATDEIVSCAFGGNRRSRREASQMASAVAREKTAIGKAETANSLGILKRLVKAMSSAPGRKLIILISPGFFISDAQAQVRDFRLAARSDVNISVLDPRGLLLPAPDLDRRSVTYLTTAEIEDAAVLEALTDATGGLFFHNNNDVEEGFRRIAAVPEYSYTLAFSPQDLKLDGRFHKLKVTVNDSVNFTVQARKGYYAPKKKP
ncbi:MAG: VWA domain-containing protein [Candidatus Sulfotelmatobacter sp.]